MVVEVQNLDIMLSSGQVYFKADGGRGGEHVWGVMEPFRREEVGRDPRRELPAAGKTKVYSRVSQSSKSSIVVGSKGFPGKLTSPGSSREIPRGDTPGANEVPFCRLFRERN